VFSPHEHGHGDRISSCGRQSEAEQIEVAVGAPGRVAIEVAEAPELGLTSDTRCSCTKSTGEEPWRHSGLEMGKCAADAMAVVIQLPATGMSSACTIRPPRRMPYAGIQGAIHVSSAGGSGGDAKTDPP
jgi:hypothetical protein